MKLRLLVIVAVLAAIPCAASAGDNLLGRTAMEIYGHVMLDMGYQVGQSNPDWFDVMRPSMLPIYEDQFGVDGHFYNSVRQTRLGFRTTTPVDDHELKTIFEFELFGVGPDAGQTTFRLRHAYGEYRSIGAGQYWSVFMDPDVFPNSLEYWGPSGMIFYRNVQLRFMPLKGDNSIAISLEKPGASGDPGVRAEDPSITELVAHWPAPDLAAQYRRNGDWGHFQLAGILRYSDLVDKGGPPNDSVSFVCWGINASTNLKISEDVLKLQVVYGNGIGNYLNDGAPDVAATLDGGAEALPLLGIVAFYDRTWNERFTSSFGYSMYDVDNTDAQMPSAFRRGQYALVNLLYHPLSNVMCGIEVQYAKRENKGDGVVEHIDGVDREIQSFDDLHIQFSFKYNFSTGLGG